MEVGWFLYKRGVSFIQHLYSNETLLLLILKQGLQVGLRVRAETAKSDYVCLAVTRCGL